MNAPEIPAELVENGAEALQETWTGSRAYGQELHRELARAVLAAALPDLMAELDALARLCAAAEHQRDRAEHQRDQAIAHDRQPYPTAWAYEQLAKAHSHCHENIRYAQDAAKRAYDERDQYAEHAGQIRADVAEAIAQAIEAIAVSPGGLDRYPWDVRDEAARIARQHAEGQA